MRILAWLCVGPEAFGAEPRVAFAILAQGYDLPVDAIATGIALDRPRATFFNLAQGARERRERGPTISQGPHVDGYPQMSAGFQ
jgi:hypothetical protein